MNNSFAFTEFILNELQKRFKTVFFIWAICFKHYLGSFAGGKHHHTHD